MHAFVMFLYFLEYLCMLEALFIEENKEKVIEGLKKRDSIEIEVMLSLIKKILSLLDDKRRIQIKLDAFFFI